MEYAINLNPVLPVRANASELSEMVTQLLFGEYCEVLKKDESFVYIRNFPDSYEGWVDAKMLTVISKEEFLSMQDKPVFRTYTPVAEVFCLTDKTIYRLSAGSLLPGYDVNTSKFGVGDMSYQVHPDFVSFLPEGEVNADGIIPISTQFLNSPYLWGGKNVFGIDCSGFVQVVYSLNGIALPRDAGQQVKEGIDVEFEDAKPGDLFFFSKMNGDKVSHVGIFLGEGCIIHASGCVKIESVNKQGIFMKDNLTCTHLLKAVRRVI